MSHGDSTRPDPRELIFLSTHEPCSMCLSAITWAGFDNFYYFFSHEDSRDAFAIPHDLKILRKFSRWNRAATIEENAFWNSYSIHKMIAELPQRIGNRLQKRAAVISDEIFRTIGAVSGRQRQELNSA